MQKTASLYFCTPKKKKLGLRNIQICKKPLRFIFALRKKKNRSAGCSTC
ncbi:Uncharacterized protein dnm_022610 [Desulfonema magnum]|uniref:Uncharacterized protein n=1 Tax=Desulfonema magnum TaxID=45655 RepID=A0A975BJ18_9BACT|nr:Uncharacterized protein dnm_022610 [Desulfonema magnum]